MALSSRGWCFSSALTVVLALFAATFAAPQTAGAQDSGYGTNGGYETYNNDAYRPDGAAGTNNGPYRPGGVYRENDDYRRYDGARTDDAYRPEGERDARGYGEPYSPAPVGPDDVPLRDEGYSQNEIMHAGHGFFGSVSKGLASVVEYVFQKAGRPNGYILGEDAGGAFIAGLRYGEGTLYTKDAGAHKVFWQGPSIGYDFGAEGSKTMVLVYNLRDPSQIYHRFGGVQGSAYLIGGVGVQFQKHGDVSLAPIRSGIGLRLGANIGYLKYTRAPTWNPF